MSPNCFAALLTDFSGSYALYQQATLRTGDFDGDGVINGGDFLEWQGNVGLTGQAGALAGDADRNGVVDHRDLAVWSSQLGATTASLASSAAFKLFFDPVGISSGAVTVFIDVPSGAPGPSRFDLGPQNIVFTVHPDYQAVQLGSPQITIGAGRERFKVRVGFTANNPGNPPQGPVTIFGYQVADELSQAGFSDIQLGFAFETNDFIILFDPATGQSTGFDETELDDAPLQLATPLFLGVETDTGAVSIRNPSLSAVSIIYYDVASALGGLDATGWVSLDDGEGGDPPGSGWDESGGSGSLGLGESNITGSLTLNPGQSVPLGFAFQANSAVRDLTFNYVTLQGAFASGVVKYIESTHAIQVPESTSGAILAIVFAMAVMRLRDLEGFW